MTQVFSRPGEAKEPVAKTEATATAVVDKKDENCKAIVNLISQRDCWVRKAKAGKKNLQGTFLDGANLVYADLRDADLFGIKSTGLQ